MSYVRADTAPEILIAEDSATQCQRLQHILEQQGYRVVPTANGRLALEAAQRRKPALIISDVIMPEMSGYDLCKQVKADATLADVPVILVTTLSGSSRDDIPIGIKGVRRLPPARPLAARRLRAVPRLRAVLRSLGQAERRKSDAAQVRQPRIL